MRLDRRRRRLGRMPRYVVERELPAGFPRRDAEGWLALVRRNADADVTWLYSYVSEDGLRSFCVYEGRSPEAIRGPATRTPLAFAAGLTTMSAS